MNFNEIKYNLNKINFKLPCLNNEYLKKTNKLTFF